MQKYHWLPPLGSRTLFSMPVAMGYELVALALVLAAGLLSSKLSGAILLCYGTTLCSTIAAILTITLSPVFHRGFIRFNHGNILAHVAVFLEVVATIIVATLVFFSNLPKNDLITIFLGNLSLLLSAVGLGIFFYKSGLVSVEGMVIINKVGAYRFYRGFLPGAVAILLLTVGAFEERWALVIGSDSSTAHVIFLVLLTLLGALALWKGALSYYYDRA